MCGIVGYVGKLNATDIIIKGLSALNIGAMILPAFQFLRMGEFLL